uniref:Proteasome subunit beta type-4 n=1 Tax=Geospiza parvula TaxID=87175 RepID=A0A8C3MKH3_GEOPR
MEVGAAPPPFWAGGPAPGQTYIPRALGHTDIAPRGTGTGPAALPAGRTLSPMVTGTSVLGLKFSGGVMLAADTVGSFGSLARFRGISRLLKVNDSTVLGASGDLADFQHLRQLLEQMVIDEELLGDGHSYSPRALHSWLTRVLYNRRSKINPLWNTVLIAGVYGGESFLGYVDMLGVAYEAPSLATGFGAYLAQPLLRAELERERERLPHAGGGAGAAGALPQGALLPGCSLLQQVRGRHSDGEGRGAGGAPDPGGQLGHRPRGQRFRVISRSCSGLVKSPFLSHPFLPSGTANLAVFGNKTDRLRPICVCSLGTLKKPWEFSSKTQISGSSGILGRCCGPRSIFTEIVEFLRREKPFWDGAQESLNPVHNFGAFHGIFPQNPKPGGISRPQKSN